MFLTWFQTPSGEGRREAAISHVADVQAAPPDSALQPDVSDNVSGLHSERMRAEKIYTHKGSNKEHGTRCKKQSKEVGVCDFLILGLCPLFWHRAPSSLGITQVMTATAVSLVLRLMR